jgi:hypothetical protein
VEAAGIGANQFRRRSRRAERARKPANEMAKEQAGTFDPGMESVKAGAVTGEGKAVTSQRSSDGDAAARLNALKRRPQNGRCGVDRRSARHTGPRQPTINWDCVSHVVSDQKIHSTYEKPTIAPGTTQVTAYGRVITTTTTTTVTTTIATTEILHPDELGYEESLARQKAQMEGSPEEREQLEKRYRESRTWSRGDRGGHEYFHQRHHRAAKPSRAVFTTA